jgi:hypothetical protein
MFGIAGHQQYREARLVSADLKRQCDAVHDRHADVRQKQVKLCCRRHNLFKRFRAVFNGYNVVTVKLERAAHEVPHSLIVFCE